MNMRFDQSAHEPVANLQRRCDPVGSKTIYRPFAGMRGRAVP
jgi:hypothetical protein